MWDTGREGCCCWRSHWGSGWRTSGGRRGGGRWRNHRWSRRGSGSHELRSGTENWLPSGDSGWSPRNGAESVYGPSLRCSGRTPWCPRARRRCKQGLPSPIRDRRDVPAEGIEPTRSCDHWILSPARLPIPPRRRRSVKLQGCCPTSSAAKVVHRTRRPENFPQHDSCPHPIERTKRWLPYYLGGRAHVYHFVRRFDQGRLGNAW